MKSYIQQNEGAEKIDVTGQLQICQKTSYFEEIITANLSFIQTQIPDWFEEAVLNQELIIIHDSTKLVINKPGFTSSNCGDSIYNVEGYRTSFRSGIKEYQIEMRQIKPEVIHIPDYNQNIKELEFLLSQIGKEIKLHEGARESIELAINLMRKK